MTTLHLSYGPPIPDPRSFVDVTRQLNAKERAVLSLRGFACAASFLLPAYHLFFGAREIGSATANERGYPFATLHSFLRESMLDALLMQLRRLYDPDSRSLGGGQLANLLGEIEIVAFLVERAHGAGQSGMPKELAIKHLTFVHRKCERGLVMERDGLIADWPDDRLQMYLARRAANKRVAHMTLDGYEITESDLQDLVFGSLLVARAIQRVTGDDSYSGSYEDVDIGGYEASARVLGSRHSRGLLLADLEANLDMRVARI